MARPRLTTVVREGLAKLVAAAQSTQPIVIDQAASRAMSWILKINSAWPGLAAKKRQAKLSSTPGTRSRRRRRMVIKRVRGAVR
jgi:hypothetical protein